MTDELQEQSSVEVEPTVEEQFLQQVKDVIVAQVGADSLKETYINSLGHSEPTLIVHAEHWLAVANVLRQDEQLQFDYLRNLSGVDYVTHLEAVYHLVNLQTKATVTVKVATDRTTPSIPSVTAVWATADWNEREIFDLLGIDFPGHPKLCRIMMSDDWVGFPLRKDYEPFDPEV